MAVVASSNGAALADGGAFLVAVGGAESNVAMHLASLGHPAHWLSRLGDDPLGDRVLRTITESGVDTSLVERDASCQTGVYFKDKTPGGSSRVFYYRKDSAASHMSPSDLERWNLPKSSRVHVSGITPALSASCSALIDLIVNGPYSVSFDVNYRPALWPVDQAGPRLLALADRAETVFVGLDEAQTLWDVADAEDVAGLLPNPTRVVVKDGATEAVEFLRGPGGHSLIVREGAISVDVVEPVGAGDAFAAGYLSALMSGAPALERLRSGHRLAAWNLGSLHDARPRSEGEYV
jgi:2-dehydro-3-deoxygluconokinase